MFAPLLLLLPLAAHVGAYTPSNVGPSLPQSCKWVGTAPFCSTNPASSACPSGWGVVIDGNGALAKTYWEDWWESYNPYGEWCIFGNKVFCCDEQVFNTGNCHIETISMTLEYTGPSPFKTAPGTWDKQLPAQCGQGTMVAVGVPTRPTSKTRYTWTWDVGMFCCAGR